MNQLETLLNTLIARGGKPFNLNGVTKCEIADHGIYFYEGECSVEFCSYRELVSLESGLWQFCMENGLLNSPDQYPLKDFRAKNPRPYGEISLRWDCYYKTEVYQYRLLESALVPEDKLAQFLIENIKTE